MSPPKKKIKLEDTEQSSYDFSTLPYTVLTNIFKHLDLKTVSYCATLCKTFNQISNDGSIYRKVTFKYNMDKKLLANYIPKITRPKQLTVEYRWCDNDVDIQDNYEEFDKYVIEFLTKSREHLVSAHFESCRNENVLELLANCTNLNDISFFRCKGSFQFLAGLSSLTHLRLLNCFISNQALVDCLKCNPNLKKLSLSDNSHIITSDICENLARYNINLEELHMAEKNKVRAKGFRSLARCFKLRVLEMVGGPHQCDPEDALQHIAAGCPHLEKLMLYGWKKIDDEKLMPILHFCAHLKELDLRGISITIKSCREAALSLPLLKSLDVYKCHKIKKSQIIKLQQDFKDINITNN